MPSMTTTNRPSTTTRSLAIIIGVHLLLACQYSIVVVADNCVAEFDQCVTNRDCCSGLNCVTGDWAVTTDSTCLSKRSEALDQLPKEMKQQLVRTFYSEKVPEGDRKTVDEADKILRKYALSFPQLVFKLERKYGILVMEDGDQAASSEL